MEKSAMRGGEAPKGYCHEKLWILELGVEVLSGNMVKTSTCRSFIQTLNSYVGFVKCSSFILCHISWFHSLSLYSIWIFSCNHSVVRLRVELIGWTRRLGNQRRYWSTASQIPKYNYKYKYLTHAYKKVNTSNSNTRCAFHLFSKSMNKLNQDQVCLVTLG